MGTLGALKSAGVRAGEEVVVPAYGNAEVTEAVVGLGAIPVFADVDADSYCLDPAAVSDVVNSRTAAVVAIHRFGRRADAGWIREVGKRHGLLVMVQPEPGAEPEGAERRREVATYLDGKLRGVRTPEPAAGHTYEQYVVRVPGNGRPDRDAFARALRAKGVACKVPVQAPVYRMPELRRDVFLPETERAVDETLALPLDVGASRRQLHKMVSACNALGGLLQPAF
ncbi:DegT/DnrJ/EryC1/StrS family aminotransferase [Streptomyces halobius]|uniref:DegT/DnrJ/EryC1/StrS family aminotransferase n=1 Tax=Streptomyces halobius TaxID=2879846 RepID=A0ABY4M8L3_9ACTN|nr:DegT/DnrJ/EryC1/StrS family aminotransferase [Streptomyces halobius]UQA92740.1 DegT/DnrJ/EryC1/StrS family aminotransferase [Streptomyces halobius]